ncbi:CpaF family protein [Paenibacillus psychroresistens]|uniref:CpaF family protein n=1 Tax=Paenibacillus psychroresistens TaxID=1778678 RepID=A0A6B8RMS0_9BACL|nr:CpaF family protein [Paenibacillus psychroresistens]QGQ96676.1 CpaF family protein [Paenibacillus psychroresistens]
MNDQVYETIKNLVLEQLKESIDLSNQQLMELIEEIMFQASRDQYLSVVHKEKLVKQLYYSFRGLDVLQPLIDDKTISEIMINRHDEIFIEQNGNVTRYDGKFESEQKLADIIQSIVAKVNRIVNESTPIVDARLMDGSRVNIVLPPIALKGPTMTIRKFPENPMTMGDLIEKGALSEDIADLLQQLVFTKHNIFISGGTGSGKTTFLNALTDYIPQDERIITIEDTAELRITHLPNLVSLETRNTNTEGKGGISIRSLIHTSLRMRPNRIIIGEVRGAEALDMLQAMNTGHEGSISTGHSNNTFDMLSRLETMILSGNALPIEVIRNQIASAVDIMIHLSRMRDHSRKVTEIHEVIGLKNNEVQLNPLFVFVEDDESTPVKVIGKLRTTGNKLVNKLKFTQAGLNVERW